jgi:hypothetical protein
MSLIGVWNEFDTCFGHEFDTCFGNIIGNLSLILALEYSANNLSLIRGFGNIKIPI